MNILRSISRKIIKFLSVTVIVLFAVGLVILAPIDEAPLSGEAIDRTLKEMDHLEIDFDIDTGRLRAGWSAVNITPSQSINLAGYGPRGPYQSVLDSVYARTVVFETQGKKAVIISLDLLMFPRLVKERVEEELAHLGFSKNEIFLTATHTHHSFGNWEQSMGGEFAFGKYNSQQVQDLVKNVVDGVLLAQKSADYASLGFQKIDAGELVENRLAQKTGAKDPYLRVVQIKKDNGAIGLLTAFSGHATNLDADNWELSRDYPGILVDHLESDRGIDFAMFCAGMVGSHGIASDLPKGHERITKVGTRLADKILAHGMLATFDTTAIIGGTDIEIGLPPSQMRLTKYLHVRDWVFRGLFGPLKANIKMLQIGEIIFVGMPCDYSGELSVNNQLDEYAAQKGKDLFITSFNGNYVGYITEDQHYATCDHDEVRAMNWVGPHMGSYFTSHIKSIIDASK